MPKRMTGGQAVVRALAEQGVETIFGIPGVHTLALYDALVDAPIRHVLGRHEQGVGFMADGYARASDKPGVASVITGPGVTNIATAVGEAYTDSSPVFVIASGETVQDEEQAAHDYLAEVQKRLEAEGLTVTTEIRTGFAAREIIAAGQPGDLLVMASHGRSGPARWLLGSVAEDVTRRAASPVLLIRADRGDQETATQ